MTTLQTSSATPEPGESAPEPHPRSVLCPYCGHIQPLSEQCEKCRGLFEPLSRQATQNAMGPWQLRNEKNPFTPGCSHEKLKEMVARGKVTRSTILRGPPTRQFWSLACNTPGVAVLLGECHQCHGPVQPDDYMCKACGVVLTCSTDRQTLGLSPIKLLPGEAAPHEVASSAMSRASERPAFPARTASTAPASSMIEARPSAASMPPPGAFDPRRRPSHRRRASSSGLVGAVFVFAIIAALIAAVAFTSKSSRVDAPAPVAPQAPVVPAPVRSSAPIEALSGAVVAELEAIRTLAATDDTASLESAVSRMEALLGNGREPGPSAIPAARIAELEAELEKLRVARDKRKLSEMLAPK